MKSYYATIQEIIDMDDIYEFPRSFIDAIPNNLGINLCSIEALSWQQRDDDQLVNLSIYFKPE